MSHFQLGISAAKYNLFLDDESQLGAILYHSPMAQLEK